MLKEKKGSDPFWASEKTERRRRTRNLRNYRRKILREANEARARQDGYCSYNSFRSANRRKYVWNNYSTADYFSVLAGCIYLESDFDVRDVDGYVRQNDDEFDSAYAEWVRGQELETLNAARLAALRSRVVDPSFIEFISSFNDIVPQSGDEIDPKNYSRSAVNRSRNARKFDKNKLALKSKSDWRKLESVRRELHKYSKDGKQFDGVNPESGELKSLFTDKSNYVLNHIENFLALCCGLSGADSIRSMSSILFLYVKTISTKSVSDKLWKYLCEICGEVEAQRESDVLPEGGVEIIELLKNMAKNFKLLVSNPVFSKVSYLISACVCVGLCEASSVSWTLAGIRLFNPNVYMKHVNALDLTDAILCTVTYFVEGGYEFFKTGSLAGFLFSDSKIEKLQDEYNHLKACSIHFRVGTLKSATGMEDHDYSARVANTIDGLKKLSRISTGAEKMVIDRMVTNLCEIRMEFEATRVQGGIREKPYTIFLVGSSGVGKSTLTCALPPILGMMNGFDGSPDKTATLKADDKFHSNLKGDTTVYILDDVFNTHKDFLQKSPTDDLITMSNNAMGYASKADIDEKGRVPINPKVIIANSNLPDFGAHIGSNEPAAIERRGDIRVVVFVKSEFRIDGGVSLDWRKVVLHYGGAVPVIPDVWELEVTDPVAVPSSMKGGRDEIEYRPFFGKNADGSITRVGIIKFLRFIKGHSAEHFAAQRTLVMETNNLHRNIHLCKECGHVTFCCVCDAGTQSGIEIQKSALSMLISRVMIDWSTVSSNMAMSMLNSSLIGLGAGIANLAPDHTLAMIVRFVINHVNPECTHHLLNDKMVFIGVVSTLCAFVNTWVWAIIVLLYGEWEDFIPVIIMFIISIAVCFITYKFACRAVKFREHCIFVALRDNKLLRADIIANMKRKRIDKFLAGSAVLAAAYYMIKHFMRARKVFDMLPHGNLDPDTYEDIQERDKEENYWKKVEVDPVHFSRRLQTHDMNQLCPKVARNLCYVRIKHDAGYRVCNGFFVRTNIFILPYHMLYPDADPTGVMPNEWFIKFQRRSLDCTGATFCATIDRTSWVRVPDTDFVVVNVNAGGDMADLTYLLTENSYSGLSMFVYKQNDGSVRVEPTTIQYHDDAKHKHCTFKGADYSLSGGTGPGLCMGVLLSNDKGKRIVGFHLGGRAPDYGVCGLLTKQMFEEALEALGDDRIIPHSSGEFINKCYGKSIITDADVHKHSPVHYLTESGNFNVHGSCGGGATITSQVVKSFISDLVALKLCIPNTFGPPILVPKYLPYRENLITLSNPMHGFEPRKLIQAKNDYVGPILEVIRTRDYVKDIIRVLSDLEVVNGIPHVRFVDKMNMNTSAGFPLDKPKNHFIVELPPNEIYSEPVTFTEEIWDEVKRVENLLADGKRAYIVYKACIKDEPTSTLKVKAPRIINSAPIAMQILTRRYFLGLCRFMNCHPFLCESMVGINCMGPEWEQHRQYMTRNSTLLDRCFALDYSKYDHFTSPQVSMMVYQMFIELCEATGNYTPRDIRIMRGIATEAVYPFVAYNGTLLSWCGTTPSGTSITVYQNNGANSLYQRLGFLSIELEPRGLDFRDVSFRSVVRVGDYGDDLKGTVSHEAKFFNMVTYMEYMRDRGIKVTMPDKSAEMVEFMHWDEADFLKRKDVFIPEIGMHVGALDEMSIVKSLHSNLRNKNVSREQLAVAVITGAVFEYWAHGREISDRRCAQLREVAMEAGLDVPALSKSYDDKTKSWKERYAKEVSALCIVQLADEDSTTDPYIYRDENGCIMDHPPWYVEVTDLAED